VGSAGRSKNGRVLKKAETGLSAKVRGAMTKVFFGLQQHIRTRGKVRGRASVGGGGWETEQLWEGREGEDIIRQKKREPNGGKKTLLLKKNGKPGIVS